METNWTQELQPLFQQFGKRKHPLDYQSRYQLVVMVILSAQDSDKHINELAPDIFAAYPTLNSLSRATEADLQHHIGSVRNWGNKAKWLIKLAQTVGDDENIPRTMDQLTKLPGLGRKSASVIIRESGDVAEGVIVDHAAPPSNARRSTSATEYVCPPRCEAGAGAGSRCSGRANNW